MASQRITADLEAVDRTLTIDELRLSRLNVNTSSWAGDFEAKPRVCIEHDAKVTEEALLVEWTYRIKGIDSRDQEERYSIEAVYEVVFSRTRGIHGVYKANPERAASLGYDRFVEITDSLARFYASIYVPSLVGPKFEPLLSQVCTSLGIDAIKVEYWPRSPNRLLEAVEMIWDKIDQSPTSPSKKTPTAPSKERVNNSPVAKRTRAASASRSRSTGQSRKAKRPPTAE